MTRVVPQIPAGEARHIKALAKPVVAPVTRTDRDVAEMRARIDKLAKRDRDATRRVKIHLIFVSVGIVISVALTFVSIPAVFHFGGIAAGLPAAIQEVIDWIRGW